MLPYETRTFYYAPNTEQVVVNYLNTKGQVIQPSTILTGTYGSSQIIEAPPITGYTQSNTQVQNVVLTYNGSIQTLNFVYTPVEGSVHFIFENEWGEQVAAPVTYTGDYGTAYSYNPPTLPYMNLTSASESSIGGIYNQNKETVIVHYIHYQAQITVIDMDDWGNILHTYSVKSLEGNSYNFTNPTYWNLRLDVPSQHVLKGIYTVPNELIFVVYDHIPAYVHITYYLDGSPIGTITDQGWLGYNYSFKIPQENNPYLTPYPGPASVSGYFSQTQQYVAINYYHIITTITVNYYGTNGTFLGSSSTTGYAGNSYSFQAPTSMGYYNLVSQEYYSGVFGRQNQVINVYYSYNPPIITYTTVQEVPTPDMNFDEPQNEWTPAMREAYFRAGKATFTDPNSAGYNNFYTTVYSWEGITYHATATGSGLSESPANNHPGTWQIGGFNPALGLIGAGIAGTAAYFSAAYKKKQQYTVHSGPPKSAGGSGGNGGDENIIEDISTNYDYADATRQGIAAISAAGGNEIDMPDGAFGAVGFGLGFASDISKGDSVGTAVAHNTEGFIISTDAALGVSLVVSSGIIAETGIGIALASNPVGWAIAAGLAVGFVFNLAYDNNFGNIRTTTEDIGNTLDNIK